MVDTPSRIARKSEYVAVIDQEKVTDEVEDIAIKYDPLNRSGRGRGFHVTDDGELHIDDAAVIEEHKLIEKRIPNDAIRILRLPAERGHLVHQYGENGFRLYELPAPVDGRVVGLLGRNGVGKTTALCILAGALKPNLGDYAEGKDWETIVREFRGTGVQSYLEQLSEGDVTAAYKPQQVGALPSGTAGTVREFLAARDERGVSERLADVFELEHVLDRDVGDVSGGELQRAAIAATVARAADVYLIDEPSSYLDVGQRLTVARALRDLAQDAPVVVVEHDLATLDLLSDRIHVLYGEPGGFGIVSRPLSARKGINQFLDGYLRGENVRIRDGAIDFSGGSVRPAAGGDPLLEFPRLETTLDGFSLVVDAGTLYRNEILGILGENGLGKTTFARLLAGALEPDDATFDAGISMSYKPQYLDPSFDGTVRELLSSEVDVYARDFEADIREPFGLEALFDTRVPDLSGGELQRVGIALCLAREADAYLLDEPSAYLDVNERLALANRLRTFVGNNDTACLIIDHDLSLLDYVSDRAMVFEGEPGVAGVGRSPEPVEDGVNRFLETTGVTFRRDPSTGRPRANKPGSRKDREQKRAGDYYAR